MKRILCLILALAMICCCFVACQGNKKQCSHSGGKATCISPAICELCGAAYGEVDEDNHTNSEGWKKTDKSHTKIYLCCGKSIENEEAHDWVGGICKDCDYGCSHIEGEANCKSGAACSICSKVYTEKDPMVHIGNARWEIKKTTHKSVYDCCLAVLVEEESHLWVDGVCEECEYTCSHVGGVATCTKKAVCEVCGVEYGEIDADNHDMAPTWIVDEKKHTKKYECCGTIKIQEEEHSIKYGICTVCAYTCSHIGGEATCMSRAVCEICGVAYGDKNSNNHVGTLECLKKDEHLHTMKYTCCGESIADEKHNMKDGSCQICAYVCEHAGGLATCSSQAICDKCGASYGERDLKNHIGTIEVLKRSETLHTVNYSCCGLRLADEAHDMKDGICQVCAYVDSKK